MRENQSQFAVLSLLRLGPMSGYDIKRTCESTLGYFWSESFGSIYPILKRLEVANLVRKSPESSNSNDGRKRQAYQITGAGKKALRQWLSAPPIQRSLRDELILKLFSGTTVPAETHLDHIRNLKSELMELKVELAGHQTTLKSNYSDSPDYVHWKLMIRAGKLSCEARLKWCAEAIAELEGIRS